MFQNKKIVLGVTGSIAAYKIATLASMLVKQHANVTVIMTKNATNFIHPTTFETLTGNKCLVDTFDRNFEFQVEHVSLAKSADLFLVAPASANVIGKLANGIADDMLTTTMMAFTKIKLLSPAMNTAMYENSIVQENLEKLSRHGYQIINPASGYLACGDTGAGKMPEPEVLFSYIEKELAYEKDLLGKKILVSAGPTREAIDPVRYITNHSTGKMGYAIAKAAMLRGAEVTLVSGSTNLTPSPFVNTIYTESAADMAETVKSLFPEMDCGILSAAVADYRPKKISDSKIKKTDGALSLELERTEDILQYLGGHKTENQILCGFCMETENLLENAKGKLDRKKADLIVANNLRVEGAGFGTDTNVVTLVGKDSAKELPLLSKEEVAHHILDEIKELF